VRDDPTRGDRGVEDAWERAALKFLHLEAELLDCGRYEEWFGLLTDDITYQVPVRVTRERGAGSEFSDSMFLLDENKTTLGIRIKRLTTGAAWAEDPPSRVRHFVSNVRVAPTAHADEVAVRSYLLVYRNRGSDPGHDLLSGERFDVLRREASELRLASRRVLLDQATIGTKNLAILL